MKRSESVFSLDVDGQVFELSETEFKGVLYEMVSLLVFERAVDRVSYVRQTLRSVERQPFPAPTRGTLLRPPLR
jgi:hypothetical protein